MINDLLIALVWYLVLTGFGVVVLPLSMMIFRRMPEGGILLARPLGWLLLAFLSWWAASVPILPFNSIGLCLLGLALFGLSLYTLKQNPAWFQRKWRLHWRTACNGEILAVLAFLLIFLVRIEDPSINSTEKPMDAMMLNSLVNASTMPPQDAWLAGHPINYHYGGYLLHAIPIKLTHIPPEIAYNLAFPTVTMLGVAIAFVLGRALFHRCRWAALSPVCIFFISNLAALSGVLERLSFPPNLHDWRFGFLWSSSRVIHDTGGSTINEYPFFSILWGDLHPHFSNMPFLLFFFVLAFAILRSILALSPLRMIRYEWPLLAVAAMASGFILPTNVFDFPITALFFAGLISTAILHRLWNADTHWKEVLPYFALLALPLMGYALAMPFWAYFTPPDQGTRLQISIEHSKLIEFLLVFGLHTAATLGFLFLRGRRLWMQGYRDEIHFSLGLLGILFFALWAKFGYIACALTPCLALLMWLLVIQTALQNTRSDEGPIDARLFAMVACALAWSMIAGCEFVYLKDNYGIARMNTIFKFHFSAWFLLGLGLPYLLYHDYWRSERSAFQWFVLLPIFGLFVLSLIPPVYALTWIHQIPESPRSSTLDGLAFLRQDRPHQYAIIDWIRNHTQPTDPILEVPGCGYLLESTISAFTGRPTIVGWVGHEALWRTGKMDTEIYTRKAEAERFYSTQNWEEAKAILQKYKIRAVIYITPECNDKNAILKQLETGIFRKFLPPVFSGTGLIGARYGRFELYEVPENL